MIYDCFSFFNEISLLEVRLHELSNVVDKFVLIESPIAHSGRYKPLYYWENRYLFREFKSKIIHLVIKLPTTPEEIQEAVTSQDRQWLGSEYQLGDNWVRERYQRNAMMQVLDYECNPEDIIIIEDADEMVRPSVIEQIKTMSSDQSIAINQSMYHGFLNLKCINMPWWGSKILRKKLITTPSEDRFHTMHSIGIQNGGWHFGFLGDADAIRLKIQSYAHDEFNKPEILAPGWIEGQLNVRKDVFRRGYQYEVVPIDETYPKYILDNLDKFDHLICK